MDRNEIELALRTAYAHRAANDGAKAAEIFAPNAVYRVAGDPTFCAFASTLSGNELLPRLKLTCEAFHASAFDVETLMIDGDRATVIIDATFRFAPTGETGTFELCHLWTFKDGKAVELVEYADTARLADMHARSGSPRPPAG